MKNNLKNNKMIFIIIGIIVVLLIGFSIFLIMYFKNRPKSKVEIGGQEIKVVNSGDGLYADEYVKGRYIYRGSNPNNYITFNNEVWRIVSAEDDGSIKIVRSELLEDRNFDTTGVRDKSSDGAGGDYCESAENGCNAWAISDNFVNVDFKGKVSKDSEMLIYLRDTYFKTLKDTTDIISKDWYIGSADGESDMEDQTKSEEAETWNGKVGLISASDYVKASTYKSCKSLTEMNTNYVDCKDANWMYVLDNNWWTISPYGNATQQVWYVGDAGYLNNIDASTAYGVRPALYLSDDIVLSGTGAKDNPFTIEK